MRLPPTPRPPRLSRSGLILSLYAAMAVAAVAIGAAGHRGDVFVLARGPRAGAGAAGLVGSVALGAGFALAMVFAWRWAVHRLEWARRLRREFREILGPLSPGELLLLAAASSVGEEMLFRGALLPALPAGLWLSSAAFALPHIGPGVRFLPWTASSLVAGLALGAMFLWRGDLVAPITAHFLINFINLRHICERPL